MSPRFRTHYDNLKVSRDAPPEVIRSAYKALVKKYHPDRNHGSERAVKAMQAINTSFEVLDDPVRRKAHDEWIDRKSGQTASNPYAAPRPTPQPEPFRPSPPQEPKSTYSPPPNPTSDWALRCLRWVVGIIILGLIGGVLEMCSDKPQRSAYASTPTPTPAQVSTPPPVPTKPIQVLKAPFGIKWGETPERIKAVVAKAGAKVVAEGRQEHKRIVAVEGIKHQGLQRTEFKFVNNSLCEVVLIFGADAWRDSASKMMERTIANATDKYGEGYRFKNVDVEVAGIRKRIEGWAWLQDTVSFRIVYHSRQAEDKDNSQVVLAYTSVEFPPHETVAFLTEQPGRAPFKIRSEAGFNFVVKLVDPQTKKDVMRMFVVGGQEAKFWVPVGEYELVYASGQTWYGEELLFGPETQYAKANSLLRFAPKVSTADAAKLADLERRLSSATSALRDYMVQNKFAKSDIDYIFEGRDQQANLKGPERLTTEWWQQNILDKVGNKPKLYNGLVDRLNAFNRAANALLKLHSEAGGYNGVVLTLYAVRGGNLETLPISAEDFAGDEGAAAP